MLSDWLGPVTLEQFRTTSLGRAPLAQPGTAIGAIDLLDWNVLDRVLASGPDALVVERASRGDQSDGVRIPYGLLDVLG